MGTSLFVSLSKSAEAKYTKSNADLLSPSVLVFYQSVKIEKFLHSMYFSVCERETLLFLLMNLLTGHALALKFSQFEISTYHRSQLTEHEACQEHYGEL